MREENFDSRSFFFHIPGPPACSHFWSLCHTAQSLFFDFQQEAHKCKEACPNAKVYESEKKPLPDLSANDEQPETILWGINIPD